MNWKKGFFRLALAISCLVWLFGIGLWFESGMDKPGVWSPWLVAGCIPWILFLVGVFIAQGFKKSN